MDELTPEALEDAAEVMSGRIFRHLLLAVATGGAEPKPSGGYAPPVSSPKRNLALD